MAQQVKYLLLLALLLTLLLALLITLLVADGLADLLAVIVGYLLAFLVTLGLTDLHKDRGHMKRHNRELQPCHIRALQAMVREGMGQDATCILYVLTPR